MSLKTHQFLILLVVTLLISHAQSATNWTAVDQQINDKIAKGYFSGCVLGVLSSNSTLLKKAYGTLTPRYGLYSPSTNLNTMFDVNFLTQVLGINSGFMQFYDQQRCNVTDKVSKYVSDYSKNNKSLITLNHLLLHNSGLQATFTDDFGATPAQLLTKINGLKLQYKQQTKFQYSQLGYIVLGQALVKLANKTIDQALVQILIQTGMKQSKFKPTNNTYLIPPSIYNNKGIVQGLPANKIAYFLGGVAGNAGLFTIIDNVGYFLQLLLNRGKMPNTARIFSEQVVDLFTTKATVKAYNNTRALGWDTIPPIDPPCGKKFSIHSFGLADNYGSYVWSDKQKNISIALLAAGSFPVPKTLNYAKAQGQISDAIMTALGY